MSRRIKAILASLLVTTALSAPAAVLSSDTDTVRAELYFSGVSLEMLPNGSVQAIFSVSVDKALNCNGASFILDYNQEYFTPSYIDNTVQFRNTPFTTTTDPLDDGFFAYDRNLYKPEINPFQTEVTYLLDDGIGIPEEKTSKYSAVTLENHRISMDLWFDQDKIVQNGADGELSALNGASLGGDTGGELGTVYVINKYDFRRPKDPDNVDPDNLERVTLGQLSFSVNPDRLDEIARYFPKPEPPDTVKPTDIAEVEMDNGQETYLIRTVDPEGTEEVSRYKDSWQIGVYQSRDPGDPPSKRYYRTKGGNNSDAAEGSARRYYELAVDPKQIMKVRPAEKEVTINAYQAFTDGTWDDVAQALRRYSPMATVTYVDGTQENLVIPWGEEGDEYGYGIEVWQGDAFVPVDQATDAPAYDPLEGVYRITQYVPGKSIHPLPITVKLTVTPIRLKDVQVENQTITYDLDQVVSQVTGPGDLKLPETARLITDIVPSGVSMVMDIPGWSPEQGKWPVAEASGANALTLMNALKEDSFGAAVAPPGSEGDFQQDTMPYWPDDADNGAIVADKYHYFLKQKNGNWIGEYTFHMAKTFGGDPKSGFTRAEIQAVYPWLTVEKDEYPVPNALRQIVTNGSYTNALQYKAEYVSTVLAANGQPELTLSVKRSDGTTPMKDGSRFRVWLPNGQELGTGEIEKVWPNYDEMERVDDWFPNKGTSLQNGSYDKEKQNSDTTLYYHLVTNPGDPDTGEWPEQRRTLRRYINLGGWYYVSVCEEPTNQTWSDPMPVFVPARPNEYQSDKEYNFVGENTELFHWSGGLTHYVTMPRGTYTAVTKDGQRLYDAGGTAVTLAQMQADLDAYGSYLDDKGRPKTTTRRYELPYSYHTTYDGSTGEQPGTLYSFRLGPTGTQPGDAWNHVEETFKTASSAIPAGATIWRYGPTPFYDGAVYPGYVANFYQNGMSYRTSGVVTQPADDTYEVTVRRDVVAEKKEKTLITLTSEEPIGITRKDPGDVDSNVTLATYDTRTEGYTDRQEYTFKITNVGTTPIYGLAIDGLTDNYHAEDMTGGRFVLVQPPADFLAPGQSTTFVMTYVYNLPANKAPNSSRYIDRLYIVSSDHPRGGPKGTNQDNPAADEKDNDYLLHFDAQFEVTGEKTHTVNVVVNPADRKMGDAGLIVGGDSGPMNYTPTARAYASGTTVYVAVYLEDEYILRNDPTCRDAAGNVIPVVPVTAAANGDAIQAGTLIYSFTMPDYDTTVTVNFYEPILSKLRLSDLVDFSARTDDELKPSADPKGTDNEYKVWRKSFTDKERTDADYWHNNTSQNPEADLYLATVGTAVSKDEGGQSFIDTENQYIVVIPYDAERSQVEAKLRQVVTHYDDMGLTHNEDIKPEVTMYHYTWGFAERWAATGTPPADDIKYPTQRGDTSVPTVHTSDTFKSPEPGTSDYMRITVSYENEVRHYYLEIHRAPKDPIATLNYGNSPYGMIMNDELFIRYDSNRKIDQAATTAARNAVKAAFRENGYTFRSQDPSDVLNVPYLYRRPAEYGGPAVSQAAVYWREAWVRNTQLFEPESQTGFLNIPTTETPSPSPDPGDPGTATPTKRPPNYIPDPDVYRDEENLDLDDYAFFAILGENMKEPGLAEALDSTGRPVKLSTVRVRATVTLLDTEATTQIGRFSGSETADLDLGVAGKTLVGLPEPGVLNAAKAGTWPVSSQADPATGEVTYTQVEHIRPGQYTMEYVYSDYNGEPLIVSRPLVILSGVGDVNSDGTVDSTRGKVGGKDAGDTDEAMLKNRVADPLGYVAGRWEKNASNTWEETVYQRANIFKYRVVDVNNDRNVNNIDGNLIDKIARGTAKPLRFYNPVEYVNKTTTAGPGS